MLVSVVFFSAREETSSYYSGSLSASRADDVTTLERGVCSGIWLGAGAHPKKVLALISALTQEQKRMEEAVKRRAEKWKAMERQREW
ncbi:hypothetical protein AOLI_G00178240 [Acnodon oligacanthus]